MNRRRRNVVGILLAVAMTCGGAFLIVHSWQSMTGDPVEQSRDWKIVAFLSGLFDYPTEDEKEAIEDSLDPIPCRWGYAGSGIWEIWVPADRLEQAQRILATHKSRSGRSCILVPGSPQMPLLTPQDDREAIRVGRESASSTGSQEHAERILEALRSGDDAAIGWAAHELRRQPDERAVPFLFDALDRVQDPISRGSICERLWALAPGPEAARRIHEIAQSEELPEDRYAHYDLLDAGTRAALLGDAGVLAYLLEYAIPARLNRVELTQGLEIDPEGDSDTSFPAGYLAIEELPVIQRNAGVVAERMIEALERDENSYAPIVLGYLKEERTLPLLRRRLVESNAMYGWETMLSNYLADVEFPEVLAYIEAITHISGKPLPEAVGLTDAEALRLTERWREGHETAIYILYRLRPAAAREVLAEDFRQLRAGREGDGWRLRIISFMLWSSLLDTGMSEAEVVRLFGTPDERDGDVWRYLGPEDPESDIGRLLLQFVIRDGIVAGVGPE